MAPKLPVSLLFFISILCGYSQPPVELSNNIASQKIGRKIEYILDKSKTLTYSDITNKAYIDSFLQSKMDVPFFDYQNATLWLRYTVENTTCQRVTPYLLIDYPLLYKIKLYIPNEEGIDTLYNGDGYPFSKRVIRNATNLFELKIDKHQSINYYCSIESDGDLITLPISIVEKCFFHEKNEVRSFFIGLFYGALIVLILINIFYYFNMRDNGFLYYILFIISVGLFLYARDGYAFKYFWPNSPHWANLSINFFGMATVVSVMIMIKNILDTKQNFPVYNKILLYSILIVSVLAVLPLFSDRLYRFMISFGNFITAYVVILCLVVVIISVHKKMYFARYFLAAIIFIQIGGFWVVMRNSGASGIFEFEHGMKVCTATLLLILAYGMMVKFRRMLNRSQQQAIARLEQINKMKEEANKELEEEVEKRTHELQQSYENLRQLNTEINLQKEEVLRKSKELAKKNAEIEQHSEQILSSIYYAKRIQDAVLPQKDSLTELIPSHFVFFKPRSIVSGDFYWLKQIENFIYIAVADCTGHGVPGAFMSMLGISALNEITGKGEILSPAQILNELRAKVKKSLRQAGKSGEAKDGMDIVIITINLESRELTFSGAFNPIIHIRKNKETGEPDILRIKGDRMPIGYSRKEENFTNSIIFLEPNDMLYLYTDGYIDQIGGPSNNKFMSKNFYSLLSNIYEKPTFEQLEKLQANIYDWMGINDQLDDMLVLGIKFTDVYGEVNLF
jgi:two-component system, sensor histidine kinase LadS